MWGRFDDGNGAERNRHLTIRDARVKEAAAEARHQSQRNAAAYAAELTGDMGDMGDLVRATRSAAESAVRAKLKEINPVPGLNTVNFDDTRVATGRLQDGWTYDIRSIPKTSRFSATVLHPYGDATSGGVPWPIEDPTHDADPAHPTYPTIEEAIVAARRYGDMLSELRGYPDPEKMSARGLRPTLW